MAWPKASFKKLFVLPAMKPELAFGIGKFFYGITKSRAWHIGKVSIQEVPQYVRIFLPNFAQHPACSFMDEIMWMIQQLFGQTQGVFKLVLADNAPSGDNSDALFPKIIA